MIKRLLYLAYLIALPLHAGYQFKSTQKAIDALQIAASEYRLLTASLPDSTSFPNLPPRLHKTNLPDANQNQHYTTKLEAYDFEGDNLIFSSNNLPQGWNLSSDGVLTAIPQTAGNFAFEVLVNDGKATTQVNVKLKVNTQLTGLQQEADKKIQCYRNANDIIIENSTGENIKVTLYSLSGMQIACYDTSSNSLRILLSNTLQNQLLMLKIISKNISFVNKL